MSVVTKVILNADNELRYPTIGELQILQDYFIQQKLGSDALQQLYSVENPSPNLTQQITDIEQYLCE